MVTIPFQKFFFHTTGDNNPPPFCQILIPSVKLLFFHYSFVCYLPSPISQPYPFVLVKMKNVLHPKVCLTLSKLFIWSNKMCHTKTSLPLSRFFPHSLHMKVSLNLPQPCSLASYKSLDNTFKNFKLQKVKLNERQKHATVLMKTPI